MFFVQLNEHFAMTGILLKELSNIRQRLAERLKDLRGERGWGQQDCAAAAGIPVDTLRNYEQQRRDPQLETVEQLAKAFGLTVGELLGEHRATVDEQLSKVARQAAREALEEERRLRPETNASTEKVAPIRGETVMQVPADRAELIELILQIPATHLKLAQLNLSGILEGSRARSQQQQPQPKKA